MITVVWIGVKATLAILLAFVVLVAARRARASLRHLLLASLFLFLLLLPAASSLIRTRSFDVPMPAVAAARVAAGSQPAEAKTTGELRARRSTETAATPFDWKRTVAYGYAGITSLLLASLLLGIVRLGRMAANANVWLEGTTRMNELAAQSGIRRAALVVLSRETAVPLTFGFRRSTILLPEAARFWNDGELARALRHELEHVRREDWIAQLLARAVCAIYWVHPLVWVAWRRFCFEAERACDDAVIATFQDAEDYAGQLVTLARNVRVSLVPALGMASRSRLSQRVHSLLDRNQPRGPLGRFATVTTMAAMLLLLFTIAPMRLIAAAAPEPAPVSDRDGDRPRPTGSHIWSQMGEILAELGEKGDIETMRQYLDAGVDVNTVANGDGTALIGAAKGGHMEMVRFLISRGADVNLASIGDGNPLIAASEAGHHEIVQLLLDEGAEINTIVEGDENPLIQAAWNGHRKTVVLLINRGADVNARVWERGELRTPLRMAKKEGHDEIVRMLIDAGARE